MTSLLLPPREWSSQLFSPLHRSFCADRWSSQAPYRSVEFVSAALCNRYVRRSSLLQVFLHTRLKGSMNMAEKVTLVSCDGVAFEGDTEAMMPGKIFLHDQFFDMVTMAPTLLPNTRLKGSMNVVETVTLVSCDGVAFEVDTETVMSESRFLKKVIEDMGTDAPIPLPNVSSYNLSLIIKICKRRATWMLRGFLEADFMSTPIDVQHYLEIPTRKQEKLEDMSASEVSELKDAEFIKDVCTANLETIKGLHEAAKYLDMPNLMYLTEAFLKDGVRPFMDIFLPWENFSNEQVHRKRAVEAF